MSRSERGGKLRKGAWTAEEDMLLRKCVEKYGEGKWRYVPERSGLRRCRKSCRLRWLNYLCPRINREKFSDEEDDLIIRLHKILGNRWSLIAGRLPGRTANDVKNYWNSHLSKKVRMMTKKAKMNQVTSPSVQVVRPQPRRVPLNWTASSSQSQEETAQAYCRDKPPISKPSCTLGSGTSSVPEDDHAWISSMIHGGDQESNLDVRSWLGLNDPGKDEEEEEDQEGWSFGGTTEDQWDALREWEDLLRESTSAV